MSAIQQGQINPGDAPRGGCRFVVALKPEADPVIAHFEMRSAVESVGGPFPCWVDPVGDDWLVVSGIGKTSAAAAAAWLHAVSGADPAAAWINLGIAGHPSLEPGAIRRVHKITDAGSGRSWYPPLAIGGKAGIASAALRTVDRPAAVFPDSSSLVDMEAFGVAEAAARFTSLELVHCLKVVSDNAETGFEDLSGDRRRISRLVEGLVDRMNESGFLGAVEDASVAEARRLAPPSGYDEWTEAVYFTESQKHQLKRLLRRCHALGLPLPPGEEFSDARGVLRFLETRLTRAASPAEVRS